MPIPAPSDFPLKYHPGIEQPEADEAATAEAIVSTLREISETTYRDGGHPLRSVHAKSHALLTGELEVLGNLPPVLARGLFATPARYPVVMRISTIPGDILDDNVSVPRGLGLKIIGVSGDRLEGSESDTTQDFVMVNGPVFAAPTGKAFLKNLKLLASTTDKPKAPRRPFHPFYKRLSASSRRSAARAPPLFRSAAIPRPIRSAKPILPKRPSFMATTLPRSDCFRSRLNWRS